jgi:predicted nucleic acid-binding protein
MGPGVIVADSNLVVYFLVSGDFTERAERIRAADRDWIVPSIFPHELLNVLTRYIRTGRLERDEAVKLFRRARMSVQVSDMAIDELSIFNLCMNSECSSYDMEYVALAMELGLTLVTADQKIIRAFPDVAVNLTTYGATP